VKRHANGVTCHAGAKKKRFEQKVMVDFLDILEMVLFSLLDFVAMISRCLLISNYQKQRGFSDGLQLDIDFLRSKVSASNQLTIVRNYIAGRKLESGEPHWHVRRILGQHKDYEQKTQFLEEKVLEVWSKIDGQTTFRVLLEKVIQVCQGPYVKRVTLYDLAYRISLVAGIPVDALYVKAGSKKGLDEFIKKHTPNAGQMSLDQIVGQELFRVRFCSNCEISRLFSAMQLKYPTDSFAHLENFLCWFHSRHGPKKRKKRLKRDKGDKRS
jgi:hypothetical protein